MRGIPIRWKINVYGMFYLPCLFLYFDYIIRIEELILNYKDKPSDNRGDGKKGKPTTNRPVPRP